MSKICEYWVDGRGNSVLSAWAQAIFGAINLCGYYRTNKPVADAQKAPDGYYYKKCTSPNRDKNDKKCKVFMNLF
jgi:hypothetical protein